MLGYAPPPTRHKLPPPMHMSSCTAAFRALVETLSEAKA
jgi:hypothetical protein